MLSSILFLFRLRKKEIKEKKETRACVCVSSFLYFWKSTFSTEQSANQFNLPDKAMCVRGFFLYILRHSWIKELVAGRNCLFHKYKLHARYWHSNAQLEWCDWNFFDSKTYVNVWKLSTKIRDIDACGYLLNLSISLAAAWILLWLKRGWFYIASNYTIAKKRATNRAFDYTSHTCK